MSSRLRSGIGEERADEEDEEGLMAMAVGMCHDGGEKEWHGSD